MVKVKEAVATPTYEIVLVTYKSKPLVQGLLSRLPDDIDVVIVDNAKGADGMDELAKGRPQTRYLTGPGEGFARGANLGAFSSEAEYLVFVNPDSNPSKADLDTLAGDVAADKTLAGVCATTTLPDGRVELGVGGWEPTMWRCWVHALGLHTIWPTQGLYARPKPHVPLQLDWLSGACLAVHRETFMRLHGFDESFFVYNEDMSYGRRAREANMRLAIRTDVLIPHLGGGSGEAKPRMFQMRGASMMQYLAAHNGKIATAVMKAGLIVGTGVRWLRCRMTGDRALAQCHAAYYRGMQHGAPDMS